MPEIHSDITVLFMWEVPDRLRDYLREGLQDVHNVRLIFPEPAEESTFIEHAPDADIIVGWRPSEELLDAARQLRLFINPGVGVQHLIEKFRKLNETRKVLLANGHGNTYFTAQHVVAMLLALMNRIIPHHEWMVEGKWRTGDSDARSIPLRNRKIGLLGYGAVNTKVHRMLSGFDVEFAALKRNPERDRGEESCEVELSRMYSPDELDEFLDWTDILVVGVPQTSETIGMIGANELSRLGEDGIIVNVSRGPVVDEKDLYEALKDEKIAGAAIDVWYEYRPEPDETGRKYPYHYPFHELDNVVLSPHRGASPMNDLKRWDEVIENITRMAEGRNNFINIVNLHDEY